MGRSSSVVGGGRRLSLYVDFASRARPSQVVGRLVRGVPIGVLARSLPSDVDEWRLLPTGLGRDPAPQCGPRVPPERAGAFHAYGTSWTPRVGDWSALEQNLALAFFVHGFEALPDYVMDEPSERAAKFWNDFIHKWIDRFGRRPDDVAWHPFPTSNRLIAFSSYLGRSTDSNLDRHLAQLIRRHGAFLRRRLEYDVAGNHLLLNGVALVFAGYATADKHVLERGHRILARETRQFLPDGGHEERSPGYHRLLLARLGDAAVLLTHANLAHDWLDELLARGNAWLREMCGPDGSVAQFNDCWQGPPVAVSTSPFTHLSDSGFIVIRSGGDQLVFDCGPLAPPHLPAHAHADALSFVLWLDGHRVVVDPGTYLYTGATRDPMRGTRAHSTVAVDGLDQCRFWGDFRYAVDPRVSLRRATWVDRGVIIVSGRHTGYRRLPDPTIHERAIIWLAGDGVVVVDRLAASRVHTVTSSLPLAASATSRSSRLNIGPLAGAARTEPRSYAPYLGRLETIEAKVFEQAVEPGQLFGWRILRADAAASLSSDGRAIVVQRGNHESLTLGASDLFG